MTKKETSDNTSPILTSFKFDKEHTRLDYRSSAEYLSKLPFGGASNVVYLNQPLT